MNISFSSTISFCPSSLSSATSSFGSIAAIGTSADSCGISSEGFSSLISVVIASFVSFFSSSETTVSLSETVVSSAFSFFSSSSGFLSKSAKSTPSFNTTVSNSAKGLFTSSFIVVSGVNETLSCPSIKTRSPVFTFTLSRGFTACTLNVPSPFTFTSLSVLSPSFMTSNMEETNFSASFTVILCFFATASAMSCSAVLAIIQPLLSSVFL